MAFRTWQQRFPRVYPRVVASQAPSTNAHTVDSTHVDCYEQVPSGNVQDVTFSGLDSTLWRFAELFGELQHATVTAGYISIYANGDTTETNYYTQRVLFDGATITGTRANNAYIWDSMAQNCKLRFRLMINDHFKYYQSLGEAHQDSGANLHSGTVAQANSYQLTGDKISSLTIHDSVASGISGAGNSRFRLIGWRL